MTSLPDFRNGQVVVHVSGGSGERLRFRNDNLVVEDKDGKVLLRTRFSEFLSRYGTRIQRSVFGIAGGGRVLEELRTGMEREFGRKFSQGDSVLAYNIPESACVFRRGFPEDDLSDLVVR